MRLAKDLQCLKVESYAFAAKPIDEIGKLIGAWWVWYRAVVFKPWYHWHRASEVYQDVFLMPG